MERGDYTPGLKITFRAELDKSLNMLEGIMDGILIDGRCSVDEVEELKQWVSSHEEFRRVHPFSELLPVLDRALIDDDLTDEEIKDINWLCRKMKSDSDYYDLVTADIQRLHGIMHGILSDNQVTEDEISGLKDWLDENEHLAGMFPYDELSTLLVSVLRDGKIDAGEAETLKTFFQTFIDPNHTGAIDMDASRDMKQKMTVLGVCATCPDIQFEGKAFCFTGASTKTSRSGFENIVSALGGLPKKTVTKKLDYLVIGNEGSDLWSFSCYGRKVEEAMELRKEGIKVMIVHENDFWDAVNDL